MESDEDADPTSCTSGRGGALAGSVTVSRTGKETTGTPQYEHSRLSEGISREQDEQVAMGRAFYPITRSRSSLGLRVRL